MPRNGVAFVDQVTHGPQALLPQSMPVSSPSITPLLQLAAACMSEAARSGAGSASMGTAVSGTAAASGVMPASIGPVDASAGAGPWQTGGSPSPHPVQKTAAWPASIG